MIYKFTLFPLELCRINNFRFLYVLTYFFKKIYWIFSFSSLYFYFSSILVICDVQRNGIFETAHVGIYLDKLNSTGGNLSIRCNDSISSWTFFLTISPQRTGGATVIAHDYMVDHDYHMLRKDQETRPFSAMYYFARTTNVKTIYGDCSLIYVAAFRELPYAFWFTRSNYFLAFTSLSLRYRLMSTYSKIISYYVSLYKTLKFLLTEILLTKAKIIIIFIIF